MGTLWIPMSQQLWVECHRTRKGRLQAGPEQVTSNNQVENVTARRKIKETSAHSILIDLKTCSTRRDMLRGKRIHAKVVASHNEENTYVVTALINMYAKCGSMSDACIVFDSLSELDVVAWNALLLGYADNGEGLVVLEMFSRMNATACPPNSVTYLAAIKACSSLAVNGYKEECLKWGREIHSKIGCHLNQYVQSALIVMYAKCGSMDDARIVFNRVQNLDVVTWNALLLGYTENGDGMIALELFSRMKASGCSPTSVTYIAAVKACTSLAMNGDESRKEDCLKRGRVIHLQIGLQLNHNVQNTLIDMYAKCSSMTDARFVFESVQNPDVVSWNTLLLGYADNGDGLAALEMFSSMKERRCTPNSLTYLAALKACIALAVNGDESGKKDCLIRGREIHSQIGSHLDHYVQSTLVVMYSKCGSMVDARYLFDSFKEPDVVSWNALILGYADDGKWHAALEMFSRMKARGCAPSSVTYLAALKACTSLEQESGKQNCLKRTKEIHLQIGCQLDHYVQSMLIGLYAKCGSMADARDVFCGIQKPDVVSWNALLLGYAENGDGMAVLEMFSRMKAGGCFPNSGTYVALLKSCIALAVNGDETGREDCLKQGRELHSQIGCHFDQYVHSMLIDMYATCGSMIEARLVFDSVEKPDVVSWNALLFGYVNNGEGLVALEMLSRMKTQGCVPSSVTYLAALKACGLTGALTLGRKFHQEITEVDAYVVTGLVDFYSKCGSMVEAREVFDLHSKHRDVSTWTALLAGYGTLGYSDCVFKLFEAMQDDGFRPDAVTFVCILLCCCHAGLVEKGRECLEAMSLRHGITPTVMHYNCMVDILGRANLLNEASWLIQKMSGNPNAVTWTTLLGACCKWKNVKIGKLAFQSLVDVDKKDASAYVVMAHIYGSVSMWEEQERVLETKRQVGAWKLPGQAYVMNEMREMVKFCVGDNSPILFLNVQHEL